jgi:hypothetical protein
VSRIAAPIRIAAKQTRATLQKRVLAAAASKTVRVTTSQVLKKRTTPARATKSLQMPLSRQQMIRRGHGRRERVTAGPARAPPHPRRITHVHEQRPDRSHVRLVSLGANTEQQHQGRRGERHQRHWPDCSGWPAHAHRNDARSTRACEPPALPPARSTTRKRKGERCRERRQRITRGTAD